MNEDRLPWFPCEQEKLLATLAQMKPPEGYIYCVVLLRIYDCGGACPDTLDALANRTKYNKRIVSEALDSLFKTGRLVRSPDGIHNPKSDLVIGKQKALRAERSRAGREGAKRVAEKSDTNQKEGGTFAVILPTAKSSYLDSEREGKKKDQKDLPLGESAPRAERAPPPKATRLSENWTLDDADRKFARTLLPEESIDGEADKFKDHWTSKSGKDATKTNWRGTWRNWCRKAVEINGRRSNGSNRQSGRSGADLVPGQWASTFGRRGTPGVDR